MDRHTECGKYKRRDTGHKDAGATLEPERLVQFAGGFHCGSFTRIRSSEKPPGVQPLVVIASLYLKSSMCRAHQSLAASGTSSSTAARSPPTGVRSVPRPG